MVKQPGHTHTEANVSVSDGIVCVLCERWMFITCVDVLWLIKVD